LLACEELATLDPGRSLKEIHTFHDQEHSLEVLAATLSVLGPPRGLLPVLITPGMDVNRLIRLANVLERWLIARPGRLLLTTTDLDHYHGGLSGQQAHANFMEVLARGRPEELRLELLAGRLNPCGGGPSWIFLELSRRLCCEVEVLVYGWAGPSPGAVGYTAAWAAPAGNKES
jgi:AmmeMemoRadiSam system protein B